MGIVLAILLFGFIVFFHELGHFLLAKKNKIDVDEFAVGMGPALFQKTYKGTPVQYQTAAYRRVLRYGRRRGGYGFAQQF